MNRARVREDLAKQEEIPGTLKGFPGWLLDSLTTMEFRYASLEEDTPEGYNMVIWLPDVDFIDLANSIDFNFVDDLLPSREDVIEDQQMGIA